MQAGCGPRCGSARLFRVLLGIFFRSSFDLRVIFRVSSTSSAGPKREMNVKAGLRGGLRGGRISGLIPQNKRGNGYGDAKTADLGLVFL